VAKLFEKQSTNFYYNWFSFIEDFLKSFLVCFLMGHSVDELDGGIQSTWTYTQAATSVNTTKVTECTLNRIIS